MSVRVLVGNVERTLRELPDESVHTVVTSPPYWGLRDYDGEEEQIGLEPTPELYVERLVGVFREVRRVLRSDGTLWLNLGDTYSVGTHTSKSFRRDRAEVPIPDRDTGLKQKDLVGIPWRVAFALQADGWWLRQDNIWHKPNPMPESVRDRCTKAHEYVFLLTKSARYFYDADAIAEATTSDYAEKGRRSDAGEVGPGFEIRTGLGRQEPSDTRNRRSVWTITTKPYSEAHFATFPPELPELCILAGTSEGGACSSCGAPLERLVERSGGMPLEDLPDEDLDDLRATNNDADRRRQLSGARQAAWKRENPDRFLGWRPTCDCGAAPVPAVVLDPFGGAGTTALVADRLKRDAILCELSPTYAGLAERRIVDDAPLFAEVEIEVPE